MRDAVKILRKARSFIEQGWTQGTVARGKSGREVPEDSRAAVCWCTMGAVNRALGRYPAGYAYYGSMIALKHAVGMSITEWNDRCCCSQAEALAAFDRAIEFAERGGVA